MSNFLRSHGRQHARLPCPSSTPGVHSDSRPSSQWCHPAISSSVVPFSSCPQSLPISESFPMSQLFSWGGQSTGVSALASFLPKNTQGWSPLERTGWISLQSKGLSGVLGSIYSHLLNLQQLKKITAIVLIFLITWTFTLVFSIESQRYYMCKGKILQMILPIFPLNFNIFLL